MTTTEYKEKLAIDSTKLQAALGNDFPFGRFADILSDDAKLASARTTGDCALDLAVEGLDVAERVRIQKAAKAAGYVRPWIRRPL